ncbi:hypothetical protein [Sphingobacterium sp. MYb382]|uniref:hypothetical protein n=1 Tax=Sphingobacterium sp. MYb382 TaxID=2745278 RepID=UPI0030B7E870
MSKQKLYKINAPLLIIALIALQSFATVNLCKAQKDYSKDGYIVFMQGDTLRGKILSVKKNQVAIDDGKQVQEFLSDQVYRVNNLKKGKMYAPTFLAKSSEPTGGARPGFYRVKTEKLKAPTFAELVVDGEIAVYYFANTNFSLGGGASIYGGSFGGGIIPSLAIGVAKSKFWLAIKKSTDEIIVLKSSNDGLFFSDKDKALNLIDLMEETPTLQDALANERKVNYNIFINYIKQYNELVPSPNKDERLIF